MMTKRSACLLAGGICVLSLARAIVPLPALGGDPPRKDFTNVKPADLGITRAERKKDAKTGFVVGGKNETSLIRKLTEINGIKIADLEKAMRPGELSRSGFLAKDESLLAVLAADNEYVVDKLGLTHQELAEHLLVLAAIGQQQGEKEFTYHGKTFKISVAYAKGFQESPFKDGTKTNTDVTIQNLDNGKKLQFSILVPIMMERYGFYEGKGTSYRVEPRKILDVLDFLKEKVKKE
jgi:hypothetical protein